MKIIRLKEIIKLINSSIYLNARVSIRYRTLLLFFTPSELEFVFVCVVVGFDELELDIIKLIDHVQVIEKFIGEELHVA